MRHCQTKRAPLDVVTAMFGQVLQTVQKGQRVSNSEIRLRAHMTIRVLVRTLRHFLPVCGGKVLL
jgi:hypothetical protein